MDDNLAKWEMSHMFPHKAMTAPPVISLSSQTQQERVEKEGHLSCFANREGRWRS